MTTGPVKWFNAEEDFGFIAQDGGGPGVMCNVAQGRKGPLARTTLPT